MGAAIPLVIGGGLMAGSAIAQGRAASNARAAAREREREIAALEGSRQTIINPYENIKDLSSMITNPAANLQVATKAAEIQAEQADLSLANTLDTLRATGASAGGATALATAALRSKQGISASIEQQEAANARLRAEGEFRAQQMRMSEAQRLQQADVAGQQFMFGVREQRQTGRLNRLAGLQAQSQAAAQSYQAGMYGAIGGLGGMVAGTAGEDFWKSN